ncbi:MAG: hypothetical protein J1G02_01455 [Clostridiales bacterium]|nr:hypothetical protein [Clostridiales bacterium]
MTEKDIQIISEQYKDDKAPFYEKIHQRVEEMYERKALRKKRLKTFYKVFPVSLAVVLIISLAIILPTVLQPTGEEPDGIIRYSDAELDIERLDYTIKDYQIRNNENYLYIDVYDIAEELTTLRYFKIGNESTTAYLQESFIHGETGYSIKLTIMKSNITVDEYENLVQSPQTMEVNNVAVSYDISRLFANAQFEYLGYKYYLEFDDAIDIEFLTELITNMFGTKATA